MDSSVASVVAATEGGGCEVVTLFRLFTWSSLWSQCRCRWGNRLRSLSDSSEKADDVGGMANKAKIVMIKPWLSFISFLFWFKFNKISTKQNPIDDIPVGWQPNLNERTIWKIDTWRGNETLKWMRGLMRHNWTRQRLLSNWLTFLQHCR